MCGSDGAEASSSPAAFKQMLRHVQTTVRPLLSANTRSCSEENLDILSEANCWWDAYAMRQCPHERRSHSLQKLGHAVLRGSVPI